MVCGNSDTRAPRAQPELSIIRWLYLVEVELACFIYWCHHPLHWLKLFNSGSLHWALSVFIYFRSMSGFSRSFWGYLNEKNVNRGKRSLKYICLRFTRTHPSEPELPSSIKYFFNIFSNIMHIRLNIKQWICIEHWIQIPCNGQFSFENNLKRMINFQQLELIWMSLVRRGLLGLIRQSPSCPLQLSIFTNMIHIRSGPQPEGGNRAIAPQKFSQAYVFVRCSKKVHYFAPPENICWLQPCIRLNVFLKQWICIEHWTYSHPMDSFNSRTLSNERKIVQ